MNIEQARAVFLQDLLRSLPGLPTRGGSLYLSTSSCPSSVEGCLQGCWHRCSGCIYPCLPGSSVSEKLQGRRRKDHLSALERVKPELAQNCALKCGSVRGGPRSLTLGTRHDCYTTQFYMFLEGPRADILGSTITCQASVTKPV